MYLPSANILHGFFIENPSNAGILFSMCFTTMIFDVDDTLYPPSTGIWEAIGVRIEQYMVEKVSIPIESASAERKRLFDTHGTTMRGLVAEYGIDDLDYLEYVHDIPINKYLSENVTLREILSQYPQRRIIFTNANNGHTSRVINALGIQDLFDQIVDIRSIKPWCKPQPEAFHKAFEIACIKDPESCVMIDDSLNNLLTAHELGMYTIRVGIELNIPPVDAYIKTIEELPRVFPWKTMQDQHI
jgi:putative hydrolase of the HAD superfamily